MRDAIAAIGRRMGPDVVEQCYALFSAEQQALASACPAAATDLAYGPHDRHRLDLYSRKPVEGAVPIVVFVHGGGFVTGGKGSSERWSNANVGRMAAQAGFLGVVINYRLAPEFGWPAGPEDVAAVVSWLKAHALQYGGDASRIVLAGTSAGAVHVAGYLKHAGAAANTDIRAAIMLSGLYGYTALDERDTLYYGDPALYPGRMPKEAIAATSLPLMLACAEFDPPRFQAEFLGLLQDRLERHGTMPRAMIVPGHNHYSMPMHLGTKDRRLADEICTFIRETTLCG